MNGSVMGMRSALIILDGFGLANEPRASAISERTMPFLHSLMKAAGFASLEASGEAVGLERGQAGNSEVGHLTIGAGRTVLSTLARIRSGFESGNWFACPAWQSLRKAERLHIVGLLSDAGTHAHWTTISEAAVLAVRHGIPHIFLHLFLDGVDSPIASAPRLLSALRGVCEAYPSVSIATISGRRWACDRSGDRTVSDFCRAGLFGERPQRCWSPCALESHLATGASEAHFEFHYDDRDGVIRDHDCILLTHHRADRIRQLEQSLRERAETYSVIPLDDRFPPARTFFPTQQVDDGLIQVLDQHGIAPTRVAETCKLPHVTYFMNGMRRQAPGRVIEIPSIPETEIPRAPQMSLTQLEDCIQSLLRSPSERALVANIANLDQVGHTGDILLAERAAGYVDRAVRAICETANAFGWAFVITADHGNADRMLDELDRPAVSHSSNPVPLIVGPPGRPLKLECNQGTLANVAATYLTTLGLAAPDYMHRSLVRSDDLELAH